MALTFFALSLEPILDYYLARVTIDLRCPATSSRSRPRTTLGPGRNVRLSPTNTRRSLPSTQFKAKIRVCNADVSAYRVGGHSPSPQVRSSPLRSSIFSAGSEFRLSPFQRH